MKFHETMPKTHKHLSEIAKKTDSHAFTARKTNLLEDIKMVQNQMLEAKTLTEYKLLKEKELELNEQVLEVEIKIRSIEEENKTVRVHDIPKLQELFNDEFAAFHKEYVKLDKELKKQLKKLSHDLAPVVERMKEIEALEVSAHSAKLVSEHTEGKSYLQLPIDRHSLDQEKIGLFLKKEDSLTDNVKRIVNKIQQLD